MSMTPTLADVLVVTGWAVLPTLGLLRGRRNLRATGSEAVSTASFVAAAAGFVVIGVALTPSYGRAAEPAFASHMVQHLLLGLVGPLLLVAGRVPELLPWALAGPRRSALRRRLGSLGRPPRSVLWPTAAMVAVWCSWHIPFLYGAAVQHPIVHGVEHLSVLGAGCWYWAAIAPHRRRTGGVVLASFSLTLALGLLGSVLALSGVPFYADHVSASGETSQLADQQLGALLMWTPGGLVYLAAAVIQLVRWLDVEGGTRRARLTAEEGTAR